MRDFVAESNDINEYNQIAWLVRHMSFHKPGDPMFELAMEQLVALCQRNLTLKTAGPLSDGPNLFKRLCYDQDKIIAEVDQALDTANKKADQLHSDWKKALGL